MIIYCYNKNAFKWIVRYDTVNHIGQLRGKDDRFKHKNHTIDCFAKKTPKNEKIKFGKRITDFLMRKTWKRISKKEANRIIKEWWNVK